MPEAFAWTDAVARTLIELWNRKMPLAKIAAQLGCTKQQANALAMRLRQKGVQLARRRQPSPPLDWDALARFARGEQDKPGKPRLLPRGTWILDTVENLLIAPDGKRTRAPGFADLQKRFEFEPADIGTKQRVPMVEKAKAA